MKTRLASPRPRQSGIRLEMDDRVLKHKRRQIIGRQVLFFFFSSSIIQPCKVDQVNPRTKCWKHEDVKKHLFREAASC